jgi:hypothetical protein
VKLRIRQSLIVFLILLYSFSAVADTLEIPFIREVYADDSPVGQYECASIVSNGDNSYTFSTEKCRVWDGNSWEAWSLSSGFGPSDTTYKISNAQVGYELHKTTGNITYYNSYFNSTRVSMEYWTVEVNLDGVWYDSLVHSANPTISYHSKKMV